MNNQDKPKYCGECANFQGEELTAIHIFDGGDGRGRCSPNKMIVYGQDTACPWGIKEDKKDGK
jgi:hypothetical protein